MDVASVSAQQFLSRIGSIRNKVLSIALIATVGFAVFLSFFFYQASSNSKRITAIKVQYTPQLEWARLNVLALDTFTRGLEVAVATRDSDLLDQALSVSVEQKQRFKFIVDNQSSLAGEIKSVESYWDDYVNYSADFSKKLLSSKIAIAEIKTIQKESQIKRNNLETALNNFLKSRSDLYNAELDATLTAQKLSLIVGVSTGVVVAIAMFVTGFLVANNVSRSVKRVRDSLSEMARGKGDLTQRIALTSYDEVGDLTNEFNLFLSSLNTLVGKVVSANRVMSVSIHEMIDSVHITNTGAKKQNEKTIEVVSSVENMIKTSSKVLNNTEAASAFATNTTALTVDSLEMVKHMMQSIDTLASQVNESAQVIRELGKSAQSIAAVSGEISRIAEQTDLLALNAAIEAARAGELGRGFAVVADEVRNLANRTNSCTGNIRNSVNELQRNSSLAAERMELSRQMAGETASRANSASEALDTILTAVQEIRSLNMDVSETALLQNKIAEAINQAMEEITRITVQTANTADTTDRKSRILGQHASNIQHLLQSFTVEEVEYTEQVLDLEYSKKTESESDPFDQSRVDLF